MTLKEAEEIKELFLSRAPESHYYISPLMSLVNYSAHLFNGSEDESTKIGALSITRILNPNLNGETVVELFIGDNSYCFVHNSDLCKEIIERFIPIKNTVSTTVLTTQINI